MAAVVGTGAVAIPVAVTLAAPVGAAASSPTATAARTHHHHHRQHYFSGNTPDGWCYSRLIGVGSGDNGPAKSFTFYDTSGDARGLSIIKVSHDQYVYDCLGGTSHVYYDVNYDTTHVLGSDVYLQASAERYDGTGGAGPIFKAKPGQPDTGRGGTVFQNLPHFSVGPAKAGARDRRIWMVRTAVVPDDKGNGYDLLLQLAQGSGFRGLQAQVKYYRYVG